LLINYNRLALLEKHDFGEYLGFLVPIIRC